MTVRKPSLGWGGGEQKPFVPYSENPPGDPGGRPGALATTCANVRRGPRLRLCALPKTLRTLQPPPAGFSRLNGRHREPRATLLQPPLPGFRLFPAVSNSHALTPSRLQERGAYPAVGNAARHCRPPLCRVGAAPTARVDARGRPRPGAPTPRFPRRGGQTQHLLLPSTRREPHSPLSPLDSSSGCRIGPAGSAFVPWGWEIRVGPGRAGDAAELGILERGDSLPAAPPASVVVAAAAAAAAAVTAVETVPALCRPHLSYLIHHYRIPPNRGAPQHFAT
jgi:hypothetical protein